MKADDPRHGTYAGASCHRKQGHPICPACLRAERITHARNEARRLAGNPATVPAQGTVRRIMALQALGWTISDLSRKSGVPEKTLRNPFFRGVNVYAGTAERVADLYERLASVTPVGGYHERCRRMARRRGYLPPAAWDDIDRDPEPPTPDDEDFVDEVVVERILGGDYRLTASAAERAEVCRRWVESGRSLNTLARATGWKPERYWKNGEAA